MRALCTYIILMNGSLDDTVYSATIIGAEYVTND